MKAELATETAAAELGLVHRLRAGADPQSPLVVFVHGRAGECSVMWPFSRCVPERHAIILPQAQAPDKIGGFSWWDIDDRDNRTVATHAAAEKVYEFVQRSLKYYALSPRYILAFGFSQGAGLLSLLVQLHPELFRGVALLAGFLIKSERPLPSKAALPKIFMAHGSEDTIVTLSRAEESQHFFRDCGATVEFHTDPVAHKVGSNGMRTLKEWCAGFELANETR